MKHPVPLPAPPHGTVGDNQARRLFALPTPPPINQGDEVASAQLWLAVELPWLGLELFARVEEPFVVSELRQGELKVAFLNRAARAAGVRPGMKMNGAYALLPTLRERPRDEAAERTALERLAAWAGRFTPQVVVEPPSSLLLEVAGSERLFGGLERIVRELRRGVLELGYRPRLTVAPTPIGALLLARAGVRRLLRGPNELRRALMELPLDHLELPGHSLERLRRLGLKRLGELSRLPRDGLTRRYGVELLEYLDRALGRRPDPREPYRAPERYAGRLILPAEVESVERLLVAARRLLLELSGFLRARGCAIQWLKWQLIHRDGPVSHLPLGLATPGWSEERLSTLLAERLEHFELPAPVVELELRSGHLHPFDFRSETLFNDPTASRGEEAALLERLSARLGRSAISGVEGAADHRPERGWRTIQPSHATTRITAPDRPLWLLATPQVLPLLDRRPCYHGALTLRRGPERIESGWWDGFEVARDYFVAENPTGMRLWIYREPRDPGQWFLHGRFG